MCDFVSMRLHCISHSKMLLHWSVIHYQMTFEWHSGCGRGCGLEISIVSNQ